LFFTVSHYKLKPSVVQTDAGGQQCWLLGVLDGIEMFDGLLG
jgi:hypothetical protein